jgi:alpha-beta hydrolase superfamily lysophospholipase
MTQVTLTIVGALGLALGGCSYPPFTPVRMPPVDGAVVVAPPDAEHKDGVFEGVHGTKLYEQWWRPRAEPRGVVVVVHGLKDHSTRYRALAERLVKAGFAVHAFDLRGHGRSEGVRVWVDPFDDHLADLDIFFRRVREREPGKPALLFGHSMGGAIATLYTITRKPELKGLALSGAALKIDVSGAVVGGTRLIAALQPNAGVFNLDLHQFSRDPAMVAGNAFDPLVFQPAAAARTGAELLGAIGAIQERMEELTLPLLILHGAADKVTPPEGSQDLQRRARSADKTLKLYPGLFHDLLHEPEKEQVMGDLVQWMSDHVGAPAEAKAPAAPAAPPAPEKAP